MKKKTKSAYPSARTAADQDIAGLLTTLTQKLASFEAKIDTVLSRLQPRPVGLTATPPRHAGYPGEPRHQRTMYKAVCADCNKGCEVPFQPSGNRPVYCKECFAKRKSSGTTRVAPQEKHVEAAVSKRTAAKTKTAAAKKRARK